VKKGEPVMGVHVTMNMRDIVNTGSVAKLVDVLIPWNPARLVAVKLLE
jgi:hypothetical protein